MSIGSVFEYSHEYADHDDPLQFCDDCDYCEYRINSEIESGLRCEHGQYVPYLMVNGYYMTDIECTDCQIDYGPAFEPFWMKILNQLNDSGQKNELR